MNPVDFKFPFKQGEMVKFQNKLWYVEHINLAAGSFYVSVHLQSVDKMNMSRFEFDYLDLRRKDFVDAMKPSETEKMLVTVLFDGYTPFDDDDGYFLGSMDHSLDAMRYMIAGIKGNGRWYER